MARFDFISGRRCGWLYRRVVGCGGTAQAHEDDAALECPVISLECGVYRGLGLCTGRLAQASGLELDWIFPAPPGQQRALPRRFGVAGHPAGARPGRPSCTTSDGWTAGRVAAAF